MRHHDPALVQAIERLVEVARERHGAAALLVGLDRAGKTLAIEGLERASNVEVLRVDLGQLVSRYIGETEKNLDRVFARAKEADAALFFDEADALFGKRDDVHDAGDRYANQEVAYLLRCVEESRGLAILASNHRPNIDAWLFAVVWPEV